MNSAGQAHPGDSSLDHTPDEHVEVAEGLGGLHDHRACRFRVAQVGLDQQALATELLDLARHLLRAGMVAGAAVTPLGLLGQEVSKEAEPEVYALVERGLTANDKAGMVAAARSFCTDYLGGVDVDQGSEG
jgi:hypothetical protein